MKAWWLAQSERDRRILLIGAVVVVLAAFYSLLWDPLHQRGDKYRQLIAEQAQTLQWMRQSSLTAKQLMAAPTARTARAKPKRTGTLLSLVDRQARRAGLGSGLKRVEPAGKDRVRLWFDEVSFDQLVRWIGTLEKDYGADVASATLDRGKTAGRVNARLVIEGRDQ